MTSSLLAECGLSLTLNGDANYEMLKFLSLWKFFPTELICFFQSAKLGLSTFRGQLEVAFYRPCAWVRRGLPAAERSGQLDGCQAEVRWVNLGGGCLVGGWSSELDEVFLKSFEQVDFRGFERSFLSVYAPWSAMVRLTQKQSSWVCPELWNWAVKLRVDSSEDQEISRDGPHSYGR